MPAAIDVQPGRWSRMIVIYDNGYYSAVWGSFDNNRQRTIGTRWNGSGNEVGYPNRGAYPTWYVEPEFLHKHLLEGFKEALNKSDRTPAIARQLANIETALSEL